MRRLSLKSTLFGVDPDFAATGQLVCVADLDCILRPLLQEGESSVDRRADI